MLELEACISKDIKVWLNHLNIVMTFKNIKKIVHTSSYCNCVNILDIVNLPKTFQAYLNIYCVYMKSIIIQKF